MIDVLSENGEVSCHDNGTSWFEGRNEMEVFLRPVTVLEMLKMMSFPVHCDTLDHIVT